MIIKPQRPVSRISVNCVPVIVNLFSIIASDGIEPFYKVKKEVGTPPVKLPSDLGRDTYWDISFYAADGAVKDGDIIIDGEGYRYQVTAANWQSIFYHCLCQRLES